MSAWFQAAHLAAETAVPNVNIEVLESVVTSGLKAGPGEGERTRFREPADIVAADLTNAPTPAFFNVNY